MLSFMKNYRARRAAKAEDARLSAAAHKSGEEAGRAMFDAIHSYLDQRIEVVSDNLLAVLAERLLDVTAPKDGVSAADICRVEVSIFTEHAREFSNNVARDVELANKDWFDLADSSGVGDLLRDTMKQKLTDAEITLILTGTAKGGERIIELNKRGIE